MIRAALVSFVASAIASAVAAQDAGTTLALYRQELDVVRLLLDAGDEAPPREAVIEHVRLVDPRASVVHEGLAVHVRDGRIVAIGAVDAGATPGVPRIDGGGRFLVPGLVDMHVHHLVSASQHLLHTLHGVTTVRDMVGFPWLLEWRRQSREDAWIAPDLVVAGHIIASMPMGMYATTVRAPEEARRVVQAQAAAGYDAIKVHNVLAPPLFEAVADEARRVGLPLVGHIPHDITVADALAAGMLTVEHFKGYLDDRTLQISDEDWVTPTQHALVWNTPSLYTVRPNLTVDEARTWSRAPEAAYVPAILRESWMGDGLADPDDPVTALRRGQNVHRAEILRRLMPVTDRFLVGSDSGGGYAFMVPAFALFEEMRLMHEAGLDPAAVLRGATVFAARASRREGEFGDIRLGARANLVLLKINPLERVPTADDVHAVLLRGRWLDADLRASLLGRLRAVTAARPIPGGRAWAAAFERDAGALRERGYVFPAHHLTEMGVALRGAGHAEAADVVEGWRARP